MTPADISVVTIDGFVHKVKEKEELELGHAGQNPIHVRNADNEFRPARRAAHRYHLGCGMTVDTPDDELDAERWAQSGKEVDCLGCKIA